MLSKLPRGRLGAEHWPGSLPKLPQLGKSWELGRRQLESPLLLQYAIVHQQRQRDGKPMRGAAASVARRRHLAYAGGPGLAFRPLESQGLAGLHLSKAQDKHDSE